MLLDEPIELKIKHVCHGQRSVSYAAPHEWNKLPLIIFIFLKAD